MFAKWLKSALTRPGLSQRGLARHLGLDPNQVSRMVHGKRKPQIDEIESIASYVGEWPPQLLQKPTSAPTVENIGVRGTIMDNVWREPTVDRVPSERIPGVAHPTFPVEVQYAYELADGPQDVDAREFVIAVPFNLVARQIRHGDIVHVTRQRAGLIQDAVRRVVSSDGSLHMVRLSLGLAPEPMAQWTVVGLVIARTTLYRT